MGCGRAEACSCARGRASREARHVLRGPAPRAAATMHVIAFDRKSKRRRPKELERLSSRSGPPPEGLA